MSTDETPYPQKNIKEYLKENEDAVIIWICSDCEDQAYVGIDADDYVKNL